MSIKGIFPKGESFLCLKDQFGTVEYKTSLIEELIKCGNAYGKALAGLKAKGGMIPLNRFDVFSGAPIENRVKKLDRIR